LTFSWGFGPRGDFLGLVALDPVGQDPDMPTIIVRANAPTAHTRASAERASK
jgi:hypothetical protein